MRKTSKQTFAILCILVMFFAPCCYAQNGDINLLKSINGHETSFKNNFTSITAGSVNVIAIAAPVAILTTGLIKKDKKLQLQAAYFAGGYIFSAAVTHGLKVLINRPRPFVSYPFIIKREDETSYSFPSGHTSSAFYDAVSLSILYPKWYVITPALLWASSVGYAPNVSGCALPIGCVSGCGGRYW